MALQRISSADSKSLIHAVLLLVYIFVRRRRQAIELPVHPWSRYSPSLQAIKPSNYRRPESELLNGGHGQPIRVSLRQARLQLRVLQRCKVLGNTRKRFSSKSHLCSQGHLRSQRISRSPLAFCTLDHVHVILTTSPAGRILPPKATSLHMPLPQTHHPATTPLQYNQTLDGLFAHIAKLLSSAKRGVMII